MKPEIIIQLEKELNIQFKKINISEINEYEDNRFAGYVKKKNYVIGLSIIHHNLKEIPSIFSHKDLSKIEFLNLSWNKIEKIDALSHLVFLKKLDLFNNYKIKDITALKYLDKLEELDLEDNDISDISALQNLKELYYLSLRGNPIKKLDNWIVDFHMDFKWVPSALYDDDSLADGFIYLYDNPIENPPIEIITQGKEAIRNYFEEIKKDTVNLFETKKIGEIESCFIDNIIIKNFYSIKDEIELSELKDKNFIFLLGENGSGKTILLKAILITLKKFFIETQASKEITGIIDDILNSNKDFLLSAIGYQDVDKENIDEFNTTSTIFLKNLYAYGTNRHKISPTTKGEPYGFLTLFKDNEYLINVEEWIKDIERKELKKIKTITVKQVQTILKELLDVDNLQILIKEEKESKVVFVVNNIEFSLNQLSEGYISVISFVIDLISRLSDNNPAIFDIKKFKAVVLIDELDMFLHPKWEKNICNKLMNWFPQIQFFISTHSPILIQGAPKDKTIIFRLKNDNNKTELAYKYKGKEIEEWLPNILISSPLFSPDFIDTIPKEIIIKARTEKDYNEMKETDINIEKLRIKEEELRKIYLDKIIKGD